MTISFYKGFTRNPEIRKSVWVLSNIWRLGQAKNTQFGTNISYKMLLNAAECLGYSFYHFWVIKGKSKTDRGWEGGEVRGGKLTPPHPFHPRSGLNEFLAFLGLYTSTWLFAYHWRCHILKKLVMILLFLKYKQIGINSSAQKIWVFQVADFN